MTHQAANPSRLHPTVASEALQVEAPTILAVAVRCVSYPQPQRSSCALIIRNSYRKEKKENERRSQQSSGNSLGPINWFETCTMDERVYPITPKAVSAASFTLLAPDATRPLVHTSLIPLIFPHFPTFSHIFQGDSHIFSMPGPPDAVGWSELLVEPPLVQLPPLPGKNDSYWTRGCRYQDIWCAQRERDNI